MALINGGRDRVSTRTSYSCENKKVAALSESKLVVYMEATCLGIGIPSFVRIGAIRTTFCQIQQG